MFDPAKALDLSVQTTMMLMEAQMVICLRMLGMAGLWGSPPGELARMVREKQAAAAMAARAVERSVRAGEPPLAVALAALRPVRGRTRLNVARLTRKGPAA